MNYTTLNVVLIVSVFLVAIGLPCFVLVFNEYLRASRVSHLAEISRIVRSLRESAIAFSGQLQGNEYAEGDHPSQKTSAELELACFSYMADYGRLVVVSFKFESGKWPGKRRAAGHIFGILESSLDLEGLPRGWANPEADLYYMIFLESDQHRSDGGVAALESEHIREIKRLQLKAPSTGKVVYLNPDDSPSLARETGCVTDVINQALGLSASTNARS